jgi:membrane fusion protein, multidrug efflux system
MIDQLSQASLPAPPTHAALPPPEEGKGGSVVRTILVVLVIAAAVGGAAWKIHSNAATQTTTNTRMNAAGDRPTPVLVTSVAQKTMPIYLTALGTVTAYNSVTIKSRVDGQLLTVPVREGQAVKKGQLLAEIDPAPYEAALAQAQGQLIKDQANAKNADAEAQRYTALLEAGVVSKESQQSQMSMSGQAAGSIAADQAAIKAAQVNVAYTKILSPIDGIVGLRQVDPGNIVHASDSTGLLLVTQLQPISVIFTLPEDQLPQVLELVRSGKKLDVETYSRDQSTHLASGTLLTLDNSIDPTTGTDKVKAVFPNKDGALFPNQFVNVRLILQQRQNAIVVPAAAIQTGSQGSFVYLVKKGNPPAGLAGAGGGGRRGGGGGGGGRGAGGGGGAAGAAPAAGSGTGAAAGGGAGGGGRGGAGGGGGRGGANADPYYVIAQPVVVDVTEGTQVILASGVNPGDQIVIDGQEKLLNGSKVSPRTQDSTGGGGTRPASQSTETGPGTAAFGPGGAGPSEPASDKRGIETGSGVPAGGGHRGQGGTPGTSPDGQPHPHHRQGGETGQTGQQP